LEIEIEFFSQQIRSLREEHQLTQEELAHRLGVSRQSIISLERGRCLPSLPLALSLADLFHLVLEDILRPVEEQIQHNEAGTTLASTEIYEQENEWLAQIRLPENIDEEHIEVELKNGIMTVVLPKNKKNLPKVIKIKVKKA